MMGFCIAQLFRRTFAFFFISTGIKKSTRALILSQSRFNLFPAAFLLIDQNPVLPPPVG